MHKRQFERKVFAELARRLPLCLHPGGTRQQSSPDPPTLLCVYVVRAEVPKRKSKTGTQPCAVNKGWKACTENVVAVLGWLLSLDVPWC